MISSQSARLRASAHSDERRIGPHVSEQVFKTAFIFGSVGEERLHRFEMRDLTATVEVPYRHCVGAHVALCNQRIEIIVGDGAVEIGNERK